MRRKQCGVIAILLALGLTACAATQLAQTGEALKELGNQFADTGPVIDRLYDAKKMSDEDYRAWAEFAFEFKRDYPVAVRLWIAAKRAGKTETPEQLVSLVRTLKNQLLEFYLQSQGVTP